MLCNTVLETNKWKLCSPVLEPNNWKLKPSPWRNALQGIRPNSPWWPTFDMRPITRNSPSQAHRLRMPYAARPTSSLVLAVPPKICDFCMNQTGRSFDIDSCDRPRFKLFQDRLEMFEWVCTVFFKKNDPFGLHALDVYIYICWLYLLM